MTRQLPSIPCYSPTSPLSHFCERARLALSEAEVVRANPIFASGGPNETLEGNWRANRLVILEFPTVVQAKTWLDSPEYAPARALRHKYARTNMVVVEGG